MKSYMEEELVNLGDYLNLQKVNVRWTEWQKWEDRSNHYPKEEVGVYCARGLDNRGNKRVYIGKATGTDKFANRMSQHNTKHFQTRNDEFLETITQEREIMYGVLSSEKVNLTRETIKNAYIEDIEARLIRYFDTEQKNYRLANDNKFEKYEYKHEFMIVNQFKDKNNCKIMRESISVRNALNEAEKFDFNK